MLKIGVSSGLVRTFPFEKAVEIIAQTGYREIEIWMEHMELCKLSDREFINYMKRFNMGYRFHSNVCDTNLTSKNIGIRTESNKQVRNEIKRVAELGGKILTVHPGRMSSSKDIAEEFWDIQYEAFDLIAKYAQEFDVLVGVENMEMRAKEFVLTGTHINKLFASLRYPSVGLTFDIAHCMSVEEPLTFLNELNVPIVNVHMSQYAKGHMHLPMYSEKATINMIEIWRKLKTLYNGPMIIEGFIRNNEVENLTRNLYECESLLKSCNSV
jgi:sugar phosphate isomerase/epimerase